LHKTKLSVLSWEAKNKGSYYKILALTYMQPKKNAIKRRIHALTFRKVQF